MYKILGSAILAVGAISAIMYTYAWASALIDLLRRNDTKVSKWIWVFLILIANPFGTLIYLYTEDRSEKARLMLISLGSVFLAIFAGIIVSSYYEASSASLLNEVVNTL